MTELTPEQKAAKLKEFIEGAPRKTNEKKGKTATIYIRIPDELDTELNAIAKYLGIKKNALISNWIVTRSREEREKIESEAKK